MARSVETFTFAGEEAKRIHGETVPMDASVFGENRIGFYLRAPLGVVSAITPFNFPLNLVAHKVAPALAAGNTVVLKPAEETPLTAVLMADCLREAGLPDGVLELVHGDGPVTGEALVRHPLPAKISFTGSPPVGAHILQHAGLKRVTLELGNNSGTIVEPDANLDAAVPRCVMSAFANAGQVCISLQRLYVHEAIAADVHGPFPRRDARPEGRQPARPRLRCRADDLRRSGRTRGGSGLPKPSPRARRCSWVAVARAGWCGRPCSPTRGPR